MPQVVPYTTDVAIELNHHRTANRHQPGREFEVAGCRQIQECILPAIRKSNCRLINFHGDFGLWLSRLTAAGAQQDAWTALQPQRQAAPLERLLFGPGIRLSFDSIINLARAKHTIVVNDFDRVKSQEDILLACNATDSRFILFTHDEISPQKISDAGIKEILSIWLPNDLLLPVNIEDKGVL